MKDPSKELFLGLLRRSLWGKKASVIDKPSKKELVAAIKLAKVQTVMELVANEIFNEPSLEEVLNENAKTRLQLYVQSNALIHSEVNAVLADIVSELRNHGIVSVLLKGQGIAEHYRIPELRLCGDIDLYVGVDNYRRSYDVLKGVVDDMDDSSVLDGDGKHYHAQWNGIMIEVHQFSEVLSSSSMNCIYQQYASEGLSKNLVEIQLGDSKVLTPADNFNACYIFSHLWNHFLYAGIGLRQVCDWAVFIHVRGVKVDKEYLYQILTDLKLMTPWKVFGCIVVDVLGLPEEEFPFYEAKYRKKALKVLDRMMVEGNFGHETAFMRIPHRGYFYEKLFSLKCYLKRFWGMVSLFPYHAFQQVKYAFVHGLIRIFRDFGIFVHNLGL